LAHFLSVGFTKKFAKEEFTCNGFKTKSDLKHEEIQMKTNKKSQRQGKN
jgi:hypothetical protein